MRKRVESDIRRKDPSALSTKFEGSGRVRGEGSGGNGVPDANGGGKKKRAGACPSECGGPSASVVVLLIAWC